MLISIKGEEICQRNNLIDMIITERSTKVTYTQEDDELTKEEARELLKNSSFTKKENTIPEIKPKPQLLNN